jgi:signal transduction histidine kinase
VSSRSAPPIPDRRRGSRWDEPFRLAAGAIFLGWLAFGAAQLRHWIAWPIGIAGSLLALRAFHRGRVLAESRHAEVAAAAEATAARNRELDLLRGLASTLLSFRSSDELFEEVAQVAKDLLQADGGAVMIRSPEGDFLRVTAGDGLLRPGVGRLLPVDGSFSGAAIVTNEPIRTDRLREDPRNHPVAGVDQSLDAAAVVPLRSRGETIGVIAAYRGTGSTAFTDLDISLLEALAEQVEVGLDRAALLEDAKRNQLALEESNRELVKATEMKSQFLANMSHELRTPLNAIIGFADLLDSDPRLDETQRDYLESIARNGRHLLGMITSVLDAAKLEAGRMILHAEPTDLVVLVAGAIADTESLRVAKRQACKATLGTAPLECRVDAGKVRQVLINLLSNAAKFTPAGGEVAVSLTRTQAPIADPAGGGLTVREVAWISVKDSGIGIQAEDLPRLFQPFSQVDSSARRTEPGSGLGLALCKQLVELHGGAIGVESALGEGSTFWFVLPLA